MVFTAAIISALLHLAIGGFQVALIAGKPWGHLAWGGQHPGVLPTRYRFGSAISLVVLVLFAAVNLQTASLIAPIFSAQMQHVMQWIITVYAALGTLMNGISRSRGERLLWTPVVALLFAANLLILIKS